jgi:hypothetical protein
MRLFSGFDNEIQRQKTVLADREKMLEAAKAQLVKESENVLGSGFRR